ncbi:MAG: hypothetical protein GYB31_20130 [Bacteroidetes bacterium]|nr:hypothetical protein [Bacteroidota bacterium]
MKHNNYPSGSNWHKWDIHTHTPLDHEWNDKPNNLNRDEVKERFAKDYVKYAKEKGLSAIAITDHNFCNSVDELLIPFIKVEATKAGITILPGFEITATDGSGIHILAIFHEDTDFKAIHTAVERMFKAGEVLVPDNGTVPISSKSVQEIYIELKENPIGFDFLLVFAHIDRDNGVLNKKTITGIRRAQEWLNENVKIAQVSSPGSLKKDSFIGNAMNDKNHFYYRKMTFVIASDCRGIGTKELDDGRYNLGDKFTWIKAEPTFNGLKQIIHEPVSRVRIQERKPDLKLASNVIKRVRFINDRNNTDLFDDDWIELNQNLNTVIGGKSSGKSLLLTLISKTIDPSVESEWYDELIRDADFEVEWSDGVIYKLKDGDKYYDKDGNEYIKRRPISYVPQLAIHKLIENKPDEYRKIILNFLKEDDDFKKYYEDFERTKDNQVEVISNEIAEIFKNRSLYERKSNELKELGDGDAKTSELKNLQEQLNRIENKKLTPEEAKEFEEANNKLKETIEQLNSEEEILNSLSDYEKIVLKRIRDLHSDLNQEVADITSLVSPKTQTEVFSVRDQVNEAISKLESEIKHLFSEKKPTQDKIDLLRKTVEDETLKVAVYNKKTGSQEDIDEIKRKIDLITSGIEEIKKFNIVVNRIKDKIDSSAKKIIKTFKSLTQIHLNFKREIADKYSVLIADDDLTLSLDIGFDIDKFFIDFFDLFDRRFNLVDLSPNFDRNTYSFHLQSHPNVVENVLTHLLGEEKKLNFKRRNEVEKAVRAITANYYQLNFRLRQSGEDIEDMSYGKKSLILLKLYLSLNRNENPIFIDQPEDNLDNRTIYSELREFIKEKKTLRQIVIVTHNANLVVSTDAENVIVASQSGQNNKMNCKFRFEYVTGALENSFVDEEGCGILGQMGIKEHVCDVLEGGKDAFREREMKYGFR